MTSRPAETIREAISSDAALFGEIVDQLEAIAGMMDSKMTVFMFLPRAFWEPQII